jgi:acetyl esterase/lipase
VAGVAAGMVAIAAIVVHGARPVLAQSAVAQLSPAAEWATLLQNKYQVAANVTYLTATGYESKLDVYRRRDVTAPQPTLIFYHGGGWIVGTKEAALLSIVPWLEMGWNVVNVEYRMARVALAPAAVEDTLCALRFVVAQAKTYNVDASRIVVSGESAGGHLALAAGMTPANAGLTSICAGGGFAGAELAVPKVAAVINWYGITDLNDMLEGPNARSYAIQWIGAGAGRKEVAKSVSPLTYVRPGLPPTLTIHGDADPIVPYSHAVRLRDALTKAGVANELHTVTAGGHGNFSPEERTKIFTKIREFLGRHRLL